MMSREFNEIFDYLIMNLKCVLNIKLIGCVRS